MSEDGGHTARTDDTAAVGVTPDQFTQLMSAINASETRMGERFTKFQTEVRQGQENIAAKVLKRVRHVKPYTFKRKGNEEQAGFNATVDETLAEAEGEMAAIGPTTATAPALQRALETIKNGRYTFSAKKNGRCCATANSK